MSSDSGTQDLAHNGYSSDSVYFGAADPKDCAHTLLLKATDWFKLLNTNGYLEKLRSCYAAFHGAYYSALDSGHMITFGGEEGELVNMAVNHWRNLADHIVTMVTSNRPAMQAQAVNTDYKSLVQSKLATGLLEYYMREKRLEEKLKVAVEYAVVLAAGFIKMEWNPTSGEIYDHDPETGAPIYEGDLEFTNLSPFDVVVDSFKESPATDWILTRTFKNRFAIAAKYPEYKDKILALYTKDELYRFRFISSIPWQNTDDVPVYEFFHKKDEAVPEGRYMMFLDDNLVLEDSPLLYQHIPVYRIAPANILGTPYGYTPMFDILPIQEGINALYSTIMTNQNAFGVQNVIVDRGADIEFSALAGGLNIISGNFQGGQNKPEALNLTNTPAEVFKFLQMLEQAAETLSGVNSVARGSPEASLKSGSALALVQSMALQFLSGLQRQYVRLIEDLGMGIISTLKVFAAVPRVRAIAGKYNSTLMKEFTSDDLSEISRITVEVSNPMSQCLKKDTPVMMFDGSIKMVQDIQIGEKLMGPDSKPRTVKNTNSGEEMMYDVTSNDKQQKVYYGCNESHILSLRFCADNEKRYGLKQYQEIDVSVKEYLTLAPSFRRLLMGFKVGVDYSKKDLTIPPYILGLWLGDGHSAVPALTTMDSELSEVWIEYADSLNLKVRVQEQENNRSKVYFITSGQQHGPSDRNEFMNELRNLDLINNKHIPFNYLTSSREDRLALLAGILDTDGGLSNDTFIFNQKSDVLTRDVMQLARSLGFRSTTRKRMVDSHFPLKDGTGTFIGELNSTSIAGNVWEIPTKLVRKQAEEKIKSRHWLNYGITVTPVSVGTYYGFTLEEEPHFLLGDFTVTHNTTAGRVQMATELIQYGIISDPKAYFQVLQTGNLDILTEGEENAQLNIKLENENLISGQPVKAVFTDAHKAHILKHAEVLGNPDLRFNANLVNSVQAHIQEHIDLLRNTDPSLLALLGEQPLPPLGGSPLGMLPPGADVNTSQAPMPAPAPPQAAGPSQQGNGPVQLPTGQSVREPTPPKPPSPPRPPIS